ncbi:ABC transporter permease [Massilia pinisoli]|uniref:ABC transporter permease n=1 Tax=Massilia pinisoli TaxID=1772194 RepID=A0ABT1ZVZ2_9BURK|nr:ABC transporter permease [Massilia pinisoli]MCS0584112.1 ABC transporter permease [Massilia pinisoli]
MRALLRKEWIEHRLFLLGLYLGGAVVLFMAWIVARDGVTPLRAWSTLVAAYGALMSVLLANRLVMREYGAGTQLFLEALPVGRGTVLATKWLAGWGALLSFFAPAFGLVLWGAREHVYLGGGLPGAIALRSGVFLLFVYTGAFAVALTLRLRFVVWGVLFFGVALFDQQAQMPLRTWPPFALVQLDMVVVPHVPWRALAITGTLTAALAAVALLLALAARGALPVVLARPLSARARTLVAFVLVGSAGLSTLVEHRAAAPPFRLQQAVSSRGETAVHVGWQGTVAGVPAAQLAERLASDLSALRTWLGLAPLAQLSLVPDAWREPDEITFEHGGAHHLVIRAALGAPDLSLPQLQEVARGAHIVDQSPVQGWREDRSWLVWGFASWWGSEQDGARRVLLQRRAAAAARLLAARGMDVRTALAVPDAMDEQLGDCLAVALSWRAVQTLRDRLGPERFRSLMRAALSGPGADDARALIETRATARLLDEAGVPLSDLARAVDAALAPLPAGPAPAALRVDAVPQAGALAALRYRVAGSAPAGLAVRYAVLRPMMGTIDSATTSWAGAAPDGVLPMTFAAGTRVFVTADAPDPALGCRYRLGAVRAEVP